MIERLVTLSIQYRLRVLVLTGVAALAALFWGRHLRFDALPDVTGQQVLVLTSAPGYMPEEVERLVTRPVEMVLGGLPHATNQRSISRAGISAVTVLFDEELPLLQARQLVQERLSQLSTSLPVGVEPPELGPLSGGLGEVFQFTVESKQRTPTELSELVTYRLTPLLRSVPGIVEVNTWGGRTRTMDVVLDPTRMAQRGVTLKELESALLGSSGQAAGHVLELGDRGALLRGVAWPRAHGELSAAVIRREPDGRVVVVGDVADVREGEKPRLGAATVDGRGETLFVMLQMHLGENALEVLGAVHEQLAEVQKVLPGDVQLHTVYDRSELVNATLRTVFRNLLEGGVLVIGVLLLLLGSLRAGAIVAVVIPLSLLGATLGMLAFGIPGNLMSLGALDFGLLVDGGVVMAEALFFALARRPGAIVERAREATVQMARPVFYSVSMILLVYLPILALEGVEGKLFRPMALTVVFALLTALLLSLTFVPAALATFIRPGDLPAREPWLVRMLEHAFTPLLARATRHPSWVVGSALGLLGLGVVLFARLGTAFVPQLDEGDLILQTVRRPDLRIEGAVRQQLVLEQAVRRAVPEVLHIGARIGSPAVATDLMGPEQADVFIDLRPRDQWREGLDKTHLLAEIERAASGAGGIDELGFSQPIQMRFNELVAGSVTDVTLALFGEDLEQLAALEVRAAQLLRRVDGADDVRVLGPPEVAVLEVRPRPLEASAQGLGSAEILDHVTALRAGLETGVTYDGLVRVPIQLRSGAPINALSLESLPIPTPARGLVPLSRVADIEHRRGPALIHHERAARRGLVGFNVRERDLGSVVQDAQRLLEKELHPPEGVRLVWGGQFESLKSARARLAVVIPAALLGLVVLLLLLFRSVRPTALIVLNVPFAAVGGVVALNLAGLPLSISAAVGFIALSGIAVLNGVVLMSAFTQLLENGLSPRDAAHQAAEQRLRPVLMTALVAALGFVPMMFSNGVGAEVQKPLATVVVGGLITSTWLTLIILPTLVPWFYRRAASSA